MRKMEVRPGLRALLSALCALLWVGIGWAGPADDYDPVTGEPNCDSCHIKGLKPAIDYRNDPECFRCHGAGLSERFLAIDGRYKKALDGPGGGARRAAQAAEGTKGTRKEDRKEERKEKTKKAEEIEKLETKAGGAAHKAPPEMILIPAGEFTMGTDDWWPKSGPAHKRNLDAFYIDQFEVTNAQYAELVQATGHRLPDHWGGGAYPTGEGDHPVVFVDWNDASAYCRWRGQRLPTEAEWEKAARGADARAFPWGSQFDKEKANMPQTGLGHATPVGSFPQGASPYGVMDMAGNVWEWTADWYGPYPGNDHPDPNAGERYKVLRGGSWWDCTFYRCGISAPTYNRVFFDPQTRSASFGFRCAR